SSAAYAAQAADRLITRRLLTDEFLEAWVETRPQRESEIRALQHLGQTSSEDRVKPVSIGQEAGNPYRGLESFRVQDARLYFGRQALTERILDKLRTNLERDDGVRFQAIIGASGSGKSSLAQAGLLAALKGGYLPDSAQWPFVIVRPGPDPLETLAIELAADDVVGTSITDVLSLIDQLRTNKLHTTMRFALRRARGARHAVVFVDQFEEIFTLCHDDEIRRAFIDNLLHAAHIQGGPTIVLLTMRADFYGRCSAHQRLACTISSHQELIGAMTLEELRQAIECPALLTGLEVEPSLIERLCELVENRPGALSLLSFVLEALWRERDGQRLSHAAYRRIGGLEGAITRTADRWLEGLDNQTEVPVVRAMFSRLVQLGEGAGDTRRREKREVLTAIKPGVSDRLLDELIARRLITSYKDEVEVVHETLIREWTTLRTWIRHNREAWSLGQDVQRATAIWTAHGRAREELWRGARLERARELVREGALELAAEENAFVTESHAAVARARRQATWLAVIVLLAVAGLGLLAAQQWRKAEGRARQAEREREHAVIATERAEVAVLINAAKRLEDSDPTRAASLLREAPRRSLSDDWRNLAVALRERALARAVLHGHTDEVMHARFSPDGSRVATASHDGTVRVWNVAGANDPVVLAGHQKAIKSLAFDHKGAQVVTVAFDNTVRVWNSDGSGDPVVLKGQGRYFGSAQFSPDGTQVLTASNGYATVWSLDESRVPLILRHRYGVACARFSPDGKYIVTSAYDHKVRIWDSGGTGKPRVLEGHTRFVRSIAFSPDGTRFATASNDNTARVWTIDGRSKPLVLRGHSERVWSARFSPDGARVVTASSDNTARVWDLGSIDRPPTLLKGHTSGIWWADFSPDGARIVTASADGTARLWNADGSGRPLVLRGHSDAVVFAEFSPDGDFIVTASPDTTARIWSADNGVQPVTFKGQAASVSTADLSPDGARVVVATGNNAAQVWNADGSGEPLALEGHSDRVGFVRFSPDGTRIATGSHDGTVRLWNADGSGDPLVLRGHEGPVVSAEFSPDGSQLITASQEPRARLWSLRSSEPPLVVPALVPILDLNYARFSTTGKHIITVEHGTPIVRTGDGSFLPSSLGRPNGTMHALDMSPDGTYRALADEATVYIGRVDGDGDPVTHTLPTRSGRLDDVNSVRFSPDGDRLVVATSKGAVWTLPANGDDQRARLTKHDKSVAIASYSRDGNWIVTASDDGTARVLRANGAGEPLVLDAGGSAIRHAEFDANGSRVMVITKNGTVRVWDIDADVIWEQLWKSTRYCLSITERRRYVLEDEKTAIRNRQRCLDRVSAQKAALSGITSP
ncbi:MAG: hypothetical protein MJE77_11970, partial [Proteobacteria bacterium]|nr:hypothetical protein [Pseudomonadota bacterium]